MTQAEAAKFLEWVSITYYIYGPNSEPRLTGEEKIDPELLKHPNHYVHNHGLGSHTALQVVQQYEKEKQ